MKRNPKLPPQTFSVASNRRLRKLGRAQVINRTNTPQSEAQARKLPRKPLVAICFETITHHNINLQLYWLGLAQNLKVQRIG